LGSNRFMPHQIGAQCFVVTVSSLAPRRHDVLCADCFDQIRKQFACALLLARMQPRGLSAASTTAA
jgi:hypothetical protein